MKGNTTRKYSWLFRVTISAVTLSPFFKMLVEIGKRFAVRDLFIYLSAAAFVKTKGIFYKHDGDKNKHNGDSSDEDILIIIICCYMQGYACRIE